VFSIRQTTPPEKVNAAICNARFLASFWRPSRRRWSFSSDATFLRCVQHSKRPNLVQSLQPRQRIHALRVDQLAGGGGSTVGRGRHPD
jgi:hypothetical protein